MALYSYTRASLDEKSREIMGEKLFSAFICLAYQINEIMLFQQFVSISLGGYPEDSAFREKAKIHSNSAVRVLCARLYEALPLESLIDSEIKSRFHQGSNERNSLFETVASHAKAIQDIKKSKEYKLLKCIRNQEFAHITPQTVAKRSKTMYEKPSMDMFFFNTYLNSFFPVAEHLVFGSLIHSEMGGLPGEPADQIKYVKWLDWLIDLTTKCHAYFHNLSAWIAGSLEAMRLDNVDLELDETHTGSIFSIKIPIFVI